MEVTGSVPDIRPHVAGAQIAVMPLLIARGIQNKVLEAMAMARPVIASPQALEGLAVRTGVHLASATSPGEWIARIVDLLNCGDSRGRLAAAGRNYVEAAHSWSACLQPLDALLAIPAPEATLAAA